MTLFRKKLPHPEKPRILKTGKGWYCGLALKYSGAESGLISYVGEPPGWGLTPWEAFNDWIWKQS